MPAASRTQALRPHLTSTFWTDTIGTSAVAAILDGNPVPLPGTPWSIRAAAGPAGRPAVEIYVAGYVVDVLVAPPLARCVLRGACAVAWAGQPWAVAWGFLPPGAGLSVWFSRGMARRRGIAAQVSVITGGFWIAPAGGRFREVTVDHHGGRDRSRVLVARPC